MLEEKPFLKYFLIIAAILGIAYFSQKSFSQGFGNDLVSDATDEAKAYLSKGSDWTQDKIYPKISGEFEKRGDVMKEEIIEQKEEVKEGVTEKIKNYISGVTKSITNPSAPQNCDSENTSD